VVLLERIAAEVARADSVESTANSLERWKVELSEVTRQVNSTGGLQLWETVDLEQMAVVGNLEGMGHRRQLWHADVGKVRVGNDSKIASDGGQVWCGNALDVVTVESQSRVDGRERRHADGANVTESHVVRKDQVGQLEVQVCGVGVHVERTSDIGNLSAEVLEVWVVVDVEHGNSLQVDTIQVV